MTQRFTRVDQLISANIHLQPEASVLDGSTTIAHWKVIKKRTRFQNLTIKVLCDFIILQYRDCLNRLYSRRNFRLRQRT